MRRGCGDVCSLPPEGWYTLCGMAEYVGRYELIRPIAAGGMATVYLARSTAVGGFERLVAIKLMHAHIASDPDFCAMFLDEARLAARIRHPNVVATHDVEEGKSGLFLVMDYIEGPPLALILRALAKTRKQIPLDVALKILLNVLAGLHAAHELKGNDGEPLRLVHRDVNPQNVLVGEDGVTRITDFGVAHAEARLSTTRGRSVKGKIAYLSPEQIETGKVDRRSDVYAAGIVLWETLTSRRLFKQDNEGKTLSMILNGERPSPLEFRPELPAPLVDVVMRSLERSADDRFSSALELAEALETAASEAGIAIANARGVSAFVRELALDYSSNAPLRLPASGTGGVTARSEGSASAESSSTSAGAVLSASAGPRSRWRAGLLGLALLGTLGGAVALGAKLEHVRAADPAASGLSGAGPARADGPASAPASEEPATSASAAAGAIPVASADAGRGTPTGTAQVAASAAPAASRPLAPEVRPHPARPFRKRPTSSHPYHPEAL